MQTTAEGVETQDELQLVRNLGCSLVQGYIFGKPMPAEEARELAARAQRPCRTQLSAARTADADHSRSAAPLPGPGAGARLRNISSGGALVECREELPVGAEIQLDFAAGGLIDAEVRWTKGTAIRLPVQRKVQSSSSPSAAKPVVKSAAVDDSHLSLGGRTANNRFPTAARPPLRR